MTTAALQVTNLHAQSSSTQTLSSINLYAMPGEAVMLLGHNNSGRRAILRAIIGQTEKREGSVRITGIETIHNHSDEIGPLGLGMLPTYGGIFPHLTCEENLLLPDSNHDALGGAMPLTEIYELCPDLKSLRDTLGIRLSVAETRMLAIARMLRTGANVLLMDDISDGLAPMMTQTLSSMILNLKRRSYTLIVGSSNLDFCATLADRFYVIERGQITDSFSITDLPARRAGLHALLAGSRQRDAHSPPERQTKA